MEFEKTLFVSTLRSSQDYYNMFVRTTIPKMNMKNNELSEVARKRGNYMFLAKQHTAQQHKVILELYAESIAFARTGSEELAFAYGNRSAFLMHLKQFKDSIEDIERALSITTSKVFKIKLLCRKVECLKSLTELEQQVTLNKAKHYLKDVVENEEDLEGMKKLSDLVEKTESFVDATKQNLSKANLDSFDATKDLKEADQFHCVNLRQNDKYGRYLVATRDIQPGEVIYIEKYYAACLSSSRNYSNCHHCFEFCYSLIPCDHCDWAMFCSENCKNEAFQKYHDIECSLIPLIANISEESLFESTLPVRLLIIAIKEAGGIENLKDELEIMDSEVDSNFKGLLAGQKFDSKFAFVYKLKSIVKFDQGECMSIIGIFILLLKHNSFFGGNSSLDRVDDLVYNKTIIFVGSLFLKIWGVKNVNSYLLSKASSTCDHPNETGELHQRNYCRAEGTGLALVSSLINHSCLPNVSRIVAEHQKIIVFALRPIKKNEQLFDCYQFPFYEVPKNERLNYLKSFQFTCECDACINEWPVYDFTQIQLTYDNVSEMKKKMEFVIEIKKTEKLMFDGKGQLNFLTIVKDLSDLLGKATKSLGTQSAITCRFFFLLREAFDQAYGVKTKNIRSCKRPVKNISV